jgi:hypothetical protein
LVAGQSISIWNTFTTLVGGTGSSFIIYCNKIKNLGSASVTVYNLDGSGNRDAGSSPAFDLTDEVSISFANAENWISTANRMEIVFQNVGFEYASNHEDTYFEFYFIHTSTNG